MGNIDLLSSEVGNEGKKVKKRCTKVSHSITKTNKPFAIGEKLILPAFIDICREVFGESAVKKKPQVPLSARTVARQIEDMAEDIETQLLQLIVTSPWFAIQCDESNDIENKAMLLVFVRYLYIFNLDIHDDMLCALLLTKNTTTSKLFKSLNDNFAKKLNWSSCAGMCRDEAAAMIGRLSGLTVRIKEVAPECEAIRCVIHKEMLARRKISPKLNNVCDDMLKLKLISLTSGCLSRYVRTWIQSTITCLHTKVRWLSRGKSLSLVFELRKPLQTFLLEKKFRSC